MKYTVDFEIAEKKYSAPVEAEDVVAAARTVEAPKIVAINPVVEKQEAKPESTGDAAFAPGMPPFIRSLIEKVEKAGGKVFIEQISLQDLLGKKSPVSKQPEHPVDTLVHGVGELKKGFESIFESKIKTEPSFQMLDSILARFLGELLSLKTEINENNGNK